MSCVLCDVIVYSSFSSLRTDTAAVTDGGWNGTHGAPVLNPVAEGRSRDQDGTGVTVKQGIHSSNYREVRNVSAEDRRGWRGDKGERLFCGGGTQQRSGWN